MPCLVIRRDPARRQPLDHLGITVIFADLFEHVQPDFAWQSIIAKQRVPVNLDDAHSLIGQVSSRLLSILDFETGGLNFIDIFLGV